MAPSRDQIIEDAKRLATDVAAYLSEKRSEMPGRVEDIRAAARDKFGEAKDMARQGAARVDELVRENVWVTAGIAAAVGAVIGLLVSRSKRD